MTSKPLTLLDLPITIANQVLEKLELVEKLTCRKVCRSLRTAVDKVGTHFNKISVQLRDYNISVDFDGFEINYTDGLNGGSYVIFNDNFVRIALNDLKIILKHVSELYILSNEKYRENIVSSLVDILRGEIHVETITLDHFAFDDVLLILPLLNDQICQELSLKETLAINEFERITHLDLWKNAKKFNFWFCSFKCDHIEYFFHFEEFSIFLDEFPIQSAIKIRDNLLQRSTFQECTIYIVKSNFKPVDIARVFQPDYSDDSDDEPFEINYSKNNSNFEIRCEHHSSEDYKCAFNIKRI